MLGIWAARIAAFALALTSGWLLGRAAPDWRGDDEAVGGGNYGMPGYYDQPMSVPGRGFFAGAWSAGLCALGALLLAYFAWPEHPAIDEAIRYGGHDGSLLEISVLLDPRIWALLFFFAAGYVPSRLTDTGPVGPLE
jgi:hypothetical protein